MCFPSSPRLTLRRKDDGALEVPLQHKAAHGFLIIKAEQQGEEGLIEGYGSVWDAVDSYGERVLKGAFKKSLKAWKASKKLIPMLWQHRSDLPIGVWDEGLEDEKGLFLRGRVNLATQRGKEAWSDMKMGSVTGLSIGYYEIVASSWDRPGNEPRDLIELDLREVSPVTFPALREAGIDAVKQRLQKGERATEREFEALIREKLGLSRAEAKLIVASGYKAFLARDAQGTIADEELNEGLKSLGEDFAMKMPAFDL